MIIKKKEQIIIKDANRKWIKSAIIRMVGMVLGIILGVLSTVLNYDKWIDSILMAVILIIVFLLIIIIPDKIIFDGYLKERK